MKTNKFIFYSIVGISLVLNIIFGIWFLFYMNRDETVDHYVQHIHHDTMDDSSNDTPASSSSSDAWGKPIFYDNRYHYSTETPNSYIYRLEIPDTTQTVCYVVENKSYSVSPAISCFDK